MNSKYDLSWAPVLKPLFATAEMKSLSAFVQQERAQAEVYPPQDLVFNAFQLTSFENVKVVILGQDPYHNIGQAHGLSFSVPAGIAFPPSLRNIFTELSTDIPEFKIPESGDLTKWAKQGVLLLNSVLTVEAGQPTSHQKRGWEDFTDHVIDVLNENREHIVFILWGAYAQRKGQRIDQNKHLVLKAAHPSPLAANRGGFFGCKVFSKSNNYLKQNGIEPTDWQLDA